MEALLASVILMVAVAAFSQAVVGGQAATAEAMNGVRASLLADALLEEIISQPYHDPQSPDNETTRATFDDMSDYHGYAEAIGGVTDATGAAYPLPYQRFSRSAAVEVSSVIAFGGAASGLRITVTVRDVAGQTWVASRFVPEPAP